MFVGKVSLNCGLWNSVDQLEASNEKQWLSRVLLLWQAAWLVDKSSATPDNVNVIQDSPHLSGFLEVSQSFLMGTELNNQKKKILMSVLVVDGHLCKETWVKHSRNALAEQLAQNLSISSFSKEMTMEIN